MIDSLILYWDKIQIYLDQDRFKNQDQANKVTIAIKKFLEKEDMALSIFTREELFQYTNNNLGPHTLLKNTFIAKRSGDIFMISKPSWLGYSAQIATSHGAPFPYDTHVPLLWYGKSIPVGKSVRRVSITDIAPTVSFKCGVMMPSGSFGLPLVELFE